jgi:hypothetical protein
MDRPAKVVGQLPPMTEGAAVGVLIGKLPKTDAMLPGAMGLV